MALQVDQNLEIARKIMDDYLHRTGIIGTEGDIGQRYLWTDAFAVQTCFALARALEKNIYRQLAVKLIENVHFILGRHRQDDTREGWISGLSDEEGKMHPTIRGLRIGKKHRERKPSEPLNRSMEWDRDGQYFHYHTRWFNALLQAWQETGDVSYAEWAVELIKAGEEFIYENSDQLKMYWKMRTDLSSPSVESMGAHDPLEGLICVKSATRALPGKKDELKELGEKFERICQGMDWFTSDALGIGGLLLNTARSASLTVDGVKLPGVAKPKRLFEESLTGLDVFSGQIFNPLQPAEGRLAFRECGLTLGIRVLHGMGNEFSDPVFHLNRLETYLPLASEIEEFWSHPFNKKSHTWVEHMDINAVTLAASLTAPFYPRAYS